MRLLHGSLILMGCVVVAALPIAESDGNQVPAAARGLEKDTPVSVSLRNSGEPDAVAPPYDHGPASGAPSEVHKLEAVDVQARSIAMTEVKRDNEVDPKRLGTFIPNDSGPLFGFGPQGEGSGWP
ncbi:hypothetical protein CF319_g1439 [Tilletia indica]|uniref:Uncharacterized protein n=1 Tax=Tilletia walkeri TaxID=117179 RepID=A0A8X7T4L1_9BASI|nr:hypothetical protein CF327_g5022 [Tilletia walkeri]KAE8225861.1 hypothetical protein CF319_g1439 [Tilletia indica]KAE8268677.1 hypothetical protein A4X09_0g3664 [Tilletia walkeri]